ncbi:MAG: adenine phosphoribosyltransferase [Oscillospiraceae bacterium]|jgi:adenine phosphoribosyltransferase|nr:adenine phosphoribosyltransferase [Oscillospiraceae bacterium]
MSNSSWPAAWPVRLGDLAITLPLVRSDDGFQIYAFDSMGRSAWNIAAAAALAERLKPFAFDIVLTAESKSIALAEELARLLGQQEYVVLRKSRKLYMIDPLVMDVKSVTTAAPQKFYLGREQQDLLRGKRVCVLDDVISTGGTLQAIYALAKALPFTVAVNACVLTEETHWEAYDGVPVVRLDHIPLPATSAYCE